MKSILLLSILLIISCSPMFLDDDKLNEIWIGVNYNEVVQILGPYNKQIQDLKNPGNSILIWEASKNNIIIPIEKIGAKKNKLGTSISSLHIYINNDGKIVHIKKSLY